MAAAAIISPFCPHTCVPDAAAFAAAAGAASLADVSVAASVAAVAEAVA